MAIPGEVNFLFYVMFWTILAMMLVLLVALKMVMKTQKHIENINVNIEKLAKKTLKDEERILEDLEKKKKK
jgi:beta-lactam-binding protein with PASTA domain